MTVKWAKPSGSGNANHHLWDFNVVWGTPLCPSAIIHPRERASRRRISVPRFPRRRVCSFCRDLAISKGWLAT